MTSLGFRQPRFLVRAETKLDSGITVALFGFHLGNHHWFGFDNRHGCYSAPLVEDLGHINFSAKQKFHYIILRSIPTPLGNSMFVRASIIFPFGLTISSMRLCTRISNCSREFLSMNAPLFTV